MEEWIEIEGKSKEDAIERACNALNTTPSHLTYEVIGGNGSKIRARKLEQGLAGEMATVETPAKVEEMERPLMGGKAKEFVAEILRLLEEEGKISVDETPDEVRVSIEGNGSGLLIGKHGQTLEALTHLVTKMLGMDRRTAKRLVVDAEGYRERRRDTLEGLARNLASRARRERRPVSIEPMSPTDRRVIHMALADDAGVVTKSIGEGRDRRVVVVPRGYRGDIERDSSERDSEGDRGRGGRSGGGRSSGGGGRGRGRGYSSQEMDRPIHRREGPPARLHDSFDAPPDPEGDMFHEDPDAPEMEREEE